MITIPGKYTTATIMTDNLEPTVVGQITKLVNHPGFTNPIVIMPDAHAGAGGPIGFTMRLTDSVICSIVGVDIGCGMLAIKLEGLPIKDLAKLDQDIRRKVPFSMKVRNDSTQYGAKPGHPFFAAAQTTLDRLWMKLQEQFGHAVPAPGRITHEWYSDKCSQIGVTLERSQASIGTLGGGNHFIEFGISSVNNPDTQSSKTKLEHTWMVIHSGSRRFGKAICDYHQGIAKDLQKRATTGDYQAQIEAIKKSYPEKQWQKKITKLRLDVGIVSGLNTRGLEMLSGKSMYDYLYDMAFAQIYASYNRQCIAEDVLSCIQTKGPPKPRMLASNGTTPYILDTIETIHNYIDPDDLIIRKGAVASYSGKKIVIPFNMRDGTWICIGQSNAAWNNSAPHGAGRLMSRSKAKEALRQDFAEKAMEGIYTSCIPLDEAPGAYKPASDIQEAIIPTAAVIEEIKPIMNLKAK